MFTDRDEPFSDPQTELADKRLATTIRTNWYSIRTFHRCHKVMDVLNVRLWDAEVEDYNPDVVAALEAAFREVDWQCKVNAGIGCVLVHKTEERYRYFHASPNEGSAFDLPVTVNSREGLEDFIDRLSSKDVQERALRRRPNTEWRLFAVTNVAFYLYKLSGVSKVGGRSRSDDDSDDDEGDDFPEYLIRNKHVLCLLTDRKTGERFDDNLCFFRCLAIARDCECSRTCVCVKAKKRTVEELFDRYRDETGVTTETFAGIDERDLLDLERIFDISITVFELKADGASDVVWNSGQSSRDRLKVNLNVYANHFCYVRDVEKFCRSFKCQSCDAFFTRAGDVKRHSCDVERVTDFTYASGVFGPSPRVWELVERETDIRVPSELKSYPYWMTYDIEAVLLKENLPDGTATTSFLNEHQLVSVSLCSNVPGFTEPVCFVRESTVDECVSGFIAAAEALLRRRYAKILEKVRDFIRERAEAEKEFEKARFSNPKTYAYRKDLSGLMEKIEDWIRRVPLVGFNSQRYDLNVMKASLVKCFCRVLDARSGKEETRISHAVKKQDAMACIITVSPRPHPPTPGPPGH